MPWLAVQLEVDAGLADSLSDALLEAGVHSVSLEAGRVAAILDLHQDAQRLVAAAANSIGIDTPRFVTQTLGDQDWVRASQAQFAPLEVGRRLWIGAHWHRPPPDRLVVRLDPGLAFGTGSHPTTRLALADLESGLRGGERVLDYGCGSGILAIAAARLGASLVDATDIDPQAVETTLQNAAANAVRVRAVAPDALPESEYDCVISNILAQPLIVLAPLLAVRTARGGRLALSGVLESQAREVIAAYAPWLDLATAATEEGWALLAGLRR
ncbi:MAG TPA: 50S ribosomal protein L11 methyltransferase [Burkholderiales bacterium]